MSSTSLWGIHEPSLQPWRCRRMAELHRRLGDRRYRELRYRMSVAHARQRVMAIAREMGWLKSELTRRHGMLSETPGDSVNCPGGATD